MNSNKSYTVNDIKAFNKSAEDFAFSSFVKDVEMYPKPEGVDYIEATAAVDWTVEIDARKDGIRDIVINVNRVRVYGAYVFETEIGEEREEQFELTITGGDWDIKADYSDTKLSHSIYPSLVNVDPKKKQVTVEFY